MKTARRGSRVNGVNEMKVRYIGETDFPYVTEGTVYEALGIEKGPANSDWLRVITELEEDYLFYPGDFQMLNEDEE